MQTKNLDCEWLELNHEITSCRLCPRLVDWREQVARTKRRAYLDWEYWGKPVPGFGDQQGRVLVVGLAPGAHGSNRTGRMFTGDASGEFLYTALHQAGFANQPTSSHITDGLELNDMFISAAARCAPPDNKPFPEEMNNCQPYLLREMALMPQVRGIVALGQVAFQRLTGILQGRIEPGVRFIHGKAYSVQKISTGNTPYDILPYLEWLLASYHPSKQNTQTGRLTPAMFDYIWATAKQKLAT